LQDLTPDGTRAEWATYMKKYMTDANYDRVEKLEAWARARDRGLNELAEAWLLAQPQVCSVISGATKFQHVLDNLKAADWRLTPADLEEINALLT
jgi:aryl-alcohol dehydrogenase-like predicted oxidoreductase